MVRGALANFAHLAVESDQLRVGDAGEPFDPPGGGPWDAVLTDPPYGRASTTGGEVSESLLARTLPAWAGRVRPRGYLSLVVPQEAPKGLGAWGEPILAVPHRVHRSLTREFRVYRKGADPV